MKEEEEEKGEQEEKECEERRGDREWDDHKYET